METRGGYRLDLKVDGSKVGRLPSDSTAVLLLYVVAAAKDNGLGALQLAHSDLVQLGQKYCSGKRRCIYITWRE